MTGDEADVGRDDLEFQEAARTARAAEIVARRGEGPGLVSRLPGMAYQCRNDANWTMDLVSRGARTLTGYEPEELLGTGETPFASLIHPEDRDRVWRAVQAAVEEDRPFQFEYRIRCRDGSEKWVWEQGHPVRDEDGELLTLEGFILDVTDRKRQTLQLQRLIDTLDALTDQDLFGVYVIQDGRFRFVNEAFARMFGYDVSEIVDRLGPLDLTPAADHPVVRESSASGPTGGGADFRGSLRGLRKDGREFPMEVHGARSRLRDEPSLAGVVLDLSAREELRLQLRRAQQREILAELTSVITHDFNNFLTGILGGCELTEFELSDDSPALPHIALVKNTAERARVLTRGLLAYTRRGSESHELFDLNGMLEDLTAILKQVVGSPITVTVDLHPHALPLRMALSEMEQVVMNLVVNARDALNGGGTISLRTERRVDRESGKDIAVLEVSDTGVGMDAVTAARIFESFFTTKREGTGIGLSTVLGIVEESQGRIEVDSTPGEGTTFTVSLPLAEEMGDRAWTTARSAARDEGAWEARKGRILVVEDDDAVRRVIVTALGRVGYDVATAHSAEEALEHLSGEKPAPDLLLSDISLPGKTGIDLAADFRDMHPEVPILLATGYAERSVEVEGTGVRPDGFLRKPFSIEELVTEVRRCLDTEPVTDENGGTRAS